MKNFVSFASIAKRAIGLAILMLVAGAGFGAAAQSNDRIVVNIPFEFTVGKAALPAGEYVVVRRKMNLLEVRGTDSDAAAIVTTTPLAVDEAGERAQIVFNRYGEKYFLAGVQSLDGSMIVKASASKDEQRLAKAGVERQVIALASN